MLGEVHTFAYGFKVAEIAHNAVTVGIKGVVDEHNQLLALCFILKSNKMLIYLSAVSSEKGKELNAMSLLIDGIIQQYANTDFIFDFEGSMIPGLARYYKGFGGVEINFPAIQK